jgi:hypothetical protein
MAYGYARVFDDRLTTKSHKLTPKTCEFLQLLGFNKIYVFIRKYANAIQKIREVKKRGERERKR